MPFSSWFSLPFGWFGASNDNEVDLRTSKDDAVKYRGSKAGPGRGIMCLSANQIRGGCDDGAQTAGADEVVLVQYKRRYDDPSNLEGEIWEGVNDGSGSGDAAMVPLRITRHGDFWMETAALDAMIDTIQARMVARGIAGIVAPTAPSSASFPNKLVSPDGRVELDIQNADALNMTLYEDGVALWSVLTGTTPAGHAKGLRG